MSLIIRCALKAAHGGDHLFIGSTKPSGLGECQAQVPKPTPAKADLHPRVSEHAALYIDSALIATVADAILRALCATKGERAQALAEIPPVDRVKLERTATAAVRSLNQAVDDAGVWRAAQVLGYTRYMKDWDVLSPAEQLACRLEASACISAFTQHLQGTNPDYIERRTARIRAEAISRRDARRLAQGRGTADEFSRSIQNLGRELVREQARVIAFERETGEPDGRASS